MKANVINKYNNVLLYIVFRFINVQNLNIVTRNFKSLRAVGRASSVGSLWRVRFRLVRVRRLLRDVVPPGLDAVSVGVRVGVAVGVGVGAGGGARRGGETGAHGGQVAPDVVLVRRERGGAGQALLSGGEPAALDGHHAQVVQRLHVVRLQLQYASVTLCNNFRVFN